MHLIKRDKLNGLETAKQAVSSFHLELFGDRRVVKWCYVISVLPVVLYLVCEVSVENAPDPHIETCLLLLEGTPLNITTNRSLELTLNFYDQFHF